MIEKSPVITIENKYFDLLSNPYEITVCACLSRLLPYGEAFLHDSFIEYFERLGVPPASYLSAIEKLQTIGFLS